MDKSKETVSVKEIENFARKHRLEVFLCALFILASVFSFIFFGPGWTTLLGGIGAVLGILLSSKVTLFTKSMFHFIFKQEGTTQIILGVVGLIISVFVPPLIFLLLGLHGGKLMYTVAVEAYGTKG